MNISWIVFLWVVALAAGGIFSFLFGWFAPEVAAKRFLAAAFCGVFVVIYLIYLVNCCPDNSW